jgi:DnaK suppressor protein
MPPVEIGGQFTGVLQSIGAAIMLECSNRILSPQLSGDTMTPVNGYRDTLLVLRARLLGEMNQMADTALKDVDAVRMPSDMADVGTDAFEQELTLDLMGNEKEVLEQIDAALERIEHGRYGRCEACGCGIAKARLDAIPYTALCVKCASRQESGAPNRKPR